MRIFLYDLKNIITKTYVTKLEERFMGLYCFIVNFGILCTQKKKTTRKKERCHMK